ncbi:CDP-glycerol glycerophosphotransferase family protein [Candidatus Microthrix parvicella]|uniref:Teichoic acid poly(glycerol phosphate) polymerase n=1 Tax=Candidatus Neomicrothrix parvicella RN1 TaxID=1229780 RepID=R4Z0U8_9ACTN|nr:CDP-glycerol glycerophosphotransferase family protein [Candidatus Microthrix parvicella]CCM64559.1 hypothetical protein BN381_410028 [Candidatus Microthrix parvicella RN1]
MPARPDVAATRVALSPLTAPAVRKSPLGLLAPGGRVLVGLIQRMLRTLSRVVPRRADRWVFASRADAYVDNPRFLFEHVADHHHEISAVWVSGDDAVVDRVRGEGRSAARRWSISGIWSTLRAGVAVYAFDVADVNVALTGGTVGVNLYHGIPLKQIENDITVGSARRIYHPRTLADRLRAATVYYPRSIPNDLVLAPSAQVAQAMQRAFGARARHMMVGRPPRMTVSVADRAAVAAEGADRGGDDHPAVLLYAPTWRVPPGFDLAEALPDLEALESALSDANTRLLIKAHLYDKVMLPRLLDRVELVPNEAEINELIGRVDGVITDYSSVMFDAALLRIPVVFYPFDLADYVRASSTSFAFDYESLVKGHVARTYAELVDVIHSGAWRTWTFPPEVRDQVWGEGPGPAMVDSNSDLVGQITNVATSRFGPARFGRARFGRARVGGSAP